MWEAVDLLAWHYKWQKRAILEDIYFDELYFYAQKIHRHIINDQKMAVTIHHTSDPQLLYRGLEDDEYLIDDERERETEQLDVAGFERLKSVLSSNPRFVVK